jgi:hypothetical protein
MSDKAQAAAAAQSKSKHSHAASQAQPAPRKVRFNVGESYLTWLEVLRGTTAGSDGLSILCLVEMANCICTALLARRMASSKRGY